MFVATSCTTLASRALAVVIGYEVYNLTNSKLALGILGLIEAIPALSLFLYGGHVADRKDRQWILKRTLAALVVCALALTILETLDLGSAQLYVLYSVVFIAGIARGFAEPAASALEAQVVPWELFVSSSTLMATAWLAAGVVGPMAGGFAFGHFHPAWTYGAITLLYAAALSSIWRITPRPRTDPPSEETVWQSVSAGLQYVRKDQVLLGSMALDLFAVLFGGAIALLPVFARDILHVDSFGLGVLNAAPTTGALLTMLWANHHPPVKHAGRNLFLSVAGFGVTMIVFAVSTSFYLSVVALFFSGVFDGVSVVIRRAILRLMSPDHLRGRIASVSMIFISSSNEIGAFESGMAAHYLGTVTSVFAGGIVTLLIVGFAAVLAPKLRNLSLDPQNVIKQDKIVDAELNSELDPIPPAAENP